MSNRSASKTTSPTSKKRTDEQPVLAGDVRQRLLQSALHLLRSNGFPALTQARVAEVAGVRQSHLTYYFRTRNDLLKAVVEAGAAAMLGTLAMARNAGQITLPRLRSLLVASREDRGMTRLMIALMVAADEDPMLKSWLEQFDLATHAHLADTLRQLGLEVPRASLELFHATLAGAAVLGLQRNSKDASAISARIIKLAFDRLIEDSRTGAKSPSRPKKR